MTESLIKSSPIDIPEIPVEIVSEEEMALIEAALAATRSSLSSSVAPSSPSRLSLLSTISSSQFQSNAKSTETITFHSKRPLSGCSETQTINDVEDLGNLGRAQKKVKVPKSLLYRFRRKKGLAVTDITSTEWCEKQMEFSLLRGKPKKTKAMEAGTARHEKLEEEVIKKVKIHVKSVEDIWALKLMNFIVGANQLFFEGMTRELPL